VLIGVVDDCTAGVFEPGHVIPAGDFRVPVSGLDDVEFAGDIDFLELVDQHNGRIPV
jgi:hypothetical protein